MYPAELLNLFPPFPKSNMVFVAISFDPQFNSRWTEVLLPAVSKVLINNEALFAHKVNLASKNDSLITEIVKNISECRLFIGDISTIGYLPITGTTNKPIRNSNVLYEVGLAHACRLPEEVILLRSDNDQLDFDISGVRVHQYNPDNLEGSIEIVVNLVVQALKSIDDRKRISVENATKSLDVTMYFLLQESISDIPHPSTRTMREVMSNTERITAINRLLSLGMFETVFKELTPELFQGASNEVASYRVTPFGRAVLMRVREKNNFNNSFIDFMKTEDGKKMRGEIYSQSNNSNQPI